MVATDTSRPESRASFIDFIAFLNGELKKREWSVSTLARRAGLSQSYVSDVINGKANVSANFAIAAADALEDDPVHFLRLAGILPDVNPSVQEEEEIIDIVKNEGPVEAARHVDVVTTGTFAPMCSSGAFINFGHSVPTIKASKVLMNKVPAYAGVAEPGQLKSKWF